MARPEPLEDIVRDCADEAQGVRADLTKLQERMRRVRANRDRLVELLAEALHAAEFDYTPVDDWAANARAAIDEAAATTEPIR